MLKDHCAILGGVVAAYWVARARVASQKQILLEERAGQALGAGATSLAAAARLKDSRR